MSVCRLINAFLMNLAMLSLSNYVGVKYLNKKIAIGIQLNDGWDLVELSK